MQSRLDDLEFKQDQIEKKLNVSLFRVRLLRKTVIFYQLILKDLETDLGSRNTVSTDLKIMRNNKNW